MKVPDGSETRLARADNGFEVSFADLAGDGEHLLWSVNERMRVVSQRATVRPSMKERPCLRMKLTSGRQLSMSAGQQIRELDGWKPSGDLAVGSRLAVVRRLPQPTDLRSMPDAEVIMLAHMIGDGSCLKRQPVRYASIDEANLAAVSVAAAHFGVTPIRDEYAAARVTTLRLPAPYRLTHGKRNPIAEWLDGLGLFGLRSYEKFVPAAVFALNNKQIALFLRHLWATDGSVRWDSKTAQGRVYYASTCRRLIEDVMSLLLRLGVQSRITRTTKSGYRDCWFLSIDRAQNQLRFLTRVGVHGARSTRAEEVVAELFGRVRRPGTDTIPVEVWNGVKAMMRERDWSEKDFALATNTRFDGARMWTHAPGRSRLHRISATFADATLHDLATNDIYWDKVASVDVVGRRACEISSETRLPLIAQGVLVS